MVCYRARRFRSVRASSPCGRSARRSGEARQRRGSAVRCTLRGFQDARPQGPPRMRSAPWPLRRALPSPAARFQEFDHRAVDAAQRDRILWPTGTQQMYLRVGPWTFAAIATFSDMGLYTTTALKLGAPTTLNCGRGGSAGSTTACSETTVGLLASVLHVASSHWPVDLLGPPPDTPAISRRFWTYFLPGEHRRYNF